MASRRLEALESLEELPGDPETPLSYSQERFWFLHQLDQTGHAGNISLLLHLRGYLDETALEAALRAIQQRHSVLRMIFAEEDGKPVAHVGTCDEISLQIVGLPSPDRTAEIWREQPVRDLIHQALKEPFDLERGPLWRATLVRLADQEYLLFLMMHHIIGDGSSWPIVEQELAALYADFVAGRSPSLPDLVLRYGDYARRQRARVERGDLDPQLAYWQDQLAAVETLQLPNDFPRPPLRTRHAAEAATLLPATLREALHALSRREGVTEFMSLLAAWQLLMGRHSGQEDVVVGSPTANRSEAGTESMIGCFINNLVLRSDLSGDPSFLELLQRVRMVVLNALANQDIPFEKILLELQPQKRLNQTPFFNVFLNLLNLPRATYDLPALKMTVLPQPHISANFDMTLYIRDIRSESMGRQPTALRLVYDADLFSAARMQELLAQYVCLLEQIVTDPGRPISEYSLMTAQAANLLPDLREVLPEPRFEPITTLIREWADRTPSAAAVEMAGETWTYGQLWESTLALAAYLRSHGVQRGDVVAITGPKSFGLVNSIIAVLAAGGIILPIDPNLPLQRRSLMRQEAGAGLILIAGEKQTEEADGRDGAILIDPRTGRPRSSQAAVSADMLPEMQGDDPAYIFFTSGSTGVPKGILGTHKGLAHFLDWQRRQFEIGPGDRASQLIGLSFDVVLRDIFLALTSGAALVLPGEGQLYDARKLIHWLRRNKITLLHTVPSLAQLWIAAAEEMEPGAAHLDDLRWVFFSGEALNAPIVRQWRDAFGRRAELLNLYGPTETTMVKTWFQVPQDVLPGVQSVGSAMPDTQVLVINDGRLCGIGELGEIVIRTPFRTRGYINAVEEQRQFRKNPLRDDEDDLLYYTGDGGRFRPDGMLEIVGRLDGQIKIHGVRIEPAEIEAVLEQHENVLQSVVVVKEQQQSKTLVAFIVAGAPLPSGELRRYAGENLPAAMVPAAVVQIVELPLLANGKVDRKALARRPLDVVDRPAEAVAPRDETEAALAEIWCDVLGVETVDIHTSFFDAGGQSLLGMQLLSKIEQQLGSRLPLNLLFTAPTIAQLAAELDGSGVSNPAFTLVPIKPEGKRSPLFVPHGVYGDNLALTQVLPHLEADQPVYGLQAIGLHPDHAPDQSIEAMAARYIEAMRSVQPHDPYYLGGYCFGGVLAYEMAVQLQRRGERTALLVIIEGSAPSAFHDQVPIYHPQVLQTIGYTILARMQANAANGSRRARKRRQQRLGLSRDQLPAAVGVNLDEELDNLADGDAWRPEFQQRLRAMHKSQSRDYSPRPFSGRVTLIRARSARFKRLVATSFDPYRGWKNLAQGGVELRFVNGTHHSILVEPNAEQLARELTNALNDAGAAAGDWANK